MRAFLFALAFSLLLTGCGSERPPPPPPSALDQAAFPDIPWPRGWAPVAGPRHVAVAIGGTSERRYDVTLGGGSGDNAQRSADARTWFHQVLPTRGWTPAPRDGVVDRWHKQLEVLELRTGRHGGADTIRLRVTKRDLEEHRR